MLKKRQVVMLPTNEKAQLWKDIKGSLYFEQRATRNLVKNANQHLYFLSDEEIKEGDWSFNMRRKSVEKAIHMIGTSELVFCKKIIATTDSLVVYQLPSGTLSLSLPRPSQSFLEVFVNEYNRGNVIKEVMVEYETIHADRAPNGWETLLKINSKDNTITIKKSKQS